MAWCSTLRFVLDWLWAISSWLTVGFACLTGWDPTKIVFLRHVVFSKILCQMKAALNVLLLFSAFLSKYLPTCSLLIFPRLHGFQSEFFWTHQFFSQIRCEWNFCLQSLERCSTSKPGTVVPAVAHYSGDWQKRTPWAQEFKKT
jgi:hypothetical protein